MFALEIDFRDGVTPPEILFLRRTHAVIGGSESAHVVVEGAGKSDCDLRVLRSVGPEFRCQPLPRRGVRSSSAFLEGSYSRHASISIGDVSTHITALDIDLSLQPEEPPDRAAVRVLKRALCSPTPVFPAIAVKSALPVFLSFSPDQPILVGRSRKCALRLESADVSSEHARFGYDGKAFWVEDLGSTNGTFIGNERVAGRRMLKSGETVSIGAEFRLVGIADSEEFSQLNLSAGQVEASAVLKSAYPCVCSASPSVRPDRYPLLVDSRVTIGRDPANGIWVGAAHVSRTHAEIEHRGDGSVWVTDVSSNGTFIDGERLPRGIAVELPGSKTSIDLNNGILLTVFFSETDEKGKPAAEPIAAAKVSPDSKRYRVGPSRNPSMGGGGGPGQAEGVFERLAQRKGFKADVVQNEEALETSSSLPQYEQQFEIPQERLEAARADFFPIENETEQIEGEFGESPRPNRSVLVTVAVVLVAFLVALGAWVLGAGI